MYQILQSGLSTKEMYMNPYIVYGNKNQTGGALMGSRTQCMIPIEYKTPYD